VALKKMVQGQRKSFVNDLLTVIFKKYGIVSIPFTIVVAVLIWAAAHFAASPGTEVSVLWGLVRYTKPLKTHESHMPFSEIKQDSIQPPSGNNVADDSVIMPLTLDVCYNVADSNRVDRTLEFLRNKHQLRELNALESEKTVAELPLGVYFYIPASVIDNYGNNKTVSSRVLSLRADRYWTNQDYFEFHSIDGGLRIVGFMTEREASEIAYLSGKTKYKVILSPVAWGKLTTLISIPIARIESSLSREVQISKNVEYVVLDLLIK
jgi:hypothetical protein